MKKIFTSYHRPLFYGTWLLLGLFQAIFTELQDDEAYYWVFAHYLDWGYFDHPPMIAVLIKLGTYIFKGELAVRFFPLLLSTGTLLLTEKLTTPKNPFLFYALALSVAVLQISGFVAVPDVPLMFFTALFFLRYRSYLNKPTWANAGSLGVVAACLLYSKYHAVLIFFFVLLSNFKLLRNVKIYAAGLAALLLFVPHLYWQYHHNWISFRYHLFESNVNRYKFSYTTDYLLGQVLLAGPLVGFLLWPAVFRYQAKDLLQRALKATAVGVLFFFLLSTLKGKVEPNWTSPAIIPLLVLSHAYLQQNGAWRRWIWRLLPAAVLLVAAFRVCMVVNLIPVPALVDRYHGWQGWPQVMGERTKGLPVVFNNNYQRASKYWFYTGQMTYSLNNYIDRRNNYNFWPVEDSLLGKPVYMLDIYGLERFRDSIQTPLYTIGYRYDSAYHSFSAIQFKSNEYEVTTGDSVRISFTVQTPAHYQEFLSSHPEVDMPVVIGVFEGQQRLQEITLPQKLQAYVKAGGGSETIPLPAKKGTYYIRFGVYSDSDYFSHNSEKITIKQH